MRRQTRWLLLLVAILAAGCASDSGPKVGRWEGPQALVGATVAEWNQTPTGRPGWRISTTHYNIYTTIDIPEWRAMLPQVMEGGWALYVALAPGVKLSQRPMDCYLFMERQEWSQYTRTMMGPDAAIFLQIRRGGYTRGDRYVAYCIDIPPKPCPLSTAGVAAHEGWHQFLARNSKGRLPPFLEEGIACTFEGIDFKDGLPRWNTSINRNRLSDLRTALEEHRLIPLQELVALHAGEVVDKTGEKIDAFYAQSWAFAKFLREAEGGRYRPALEKWLAETADGTVFDPTHSHNHAGLPWNRAGVRPMIEHYLQMSFADVDKAYAAYVHKIAVEDYAAQWGM